MKTRQIKNMMVPLTEYSTVSKNATLKEAVEILKMAQEKYDKSIYPHRAVLVYDDNHRIIGKVSQIDVLRSLEPKYDEIFDKNTRSIGFTLNFQKFMIEKMRLMDAPMKQLCKKAAGKKVETFMTVPEEGEFIEIDASLDEAVHQFVLGRHQSLLVVEKNDIVGILRLTDVFEVVAGEISMCLV